MRWIPLLLVACSLRPALAQGSVTVDDTEVSYPTRLELELDGNHQALRLTGVGLREKVWFNVYAIASYVAEGAEVASPANLAAADVTKLLHIVMERDVDAPDIAEAFVTAIEANHPRARETFAREIAALVGYFGDEELTAGQHVRFTHLRGQGLRLQVGRREPLVIAGVSFAVAVWEIYLGDSPVTEELKTGLTRRL